MGLIEKHSQLRKKKKKPWATLVSYSLKRSEEGTTQKSRAYVSIFFYKSSNEVGL